LTDVTAHPAKVNAAAVTTLRIPIIPILAPGVFVCRSDATGYWLLVSVIGFPDRCSRTGFQARLFFASAPGNRALVATLGVRANHVPMAAMSSPIARTSMGSRRVIAGILKIPAAAPRCPYASKAQDVKSFVRRRIGFLKPDIGFITFGFSQSHWLRSCRDALQKTSSPLVKTVANKGHLTPPRQTHQICISLHLSFRVTKMRYFDIGKTGKVAKTSPIACASRRYSEKCDVLQHGYVNKNGGGPA
jgi:hypothetical protein